MNMLRVPGCIDFEYEISEGGLRNRQGYEVLSPPPLLRRPPSVCLSVSVSVCLSVSQSLTERE